MYMYTPLVSIIIPVYNGSNYLREAIESALAQTYKNCEILVINDGSTDNDESEKIAQSYSDRIRYFKKSNGGVSSALNYAFEKMNGEWFSWLSHDDLYHPAKIEKQIEYINKLKNRGVDISKITVRCATESIDKDGKIIRVPSYSNVLEHELCIDTILNNVYNYRLSGCSFLLPKNCIDKVGLFNEDIRTVSDVEYWYRLLFAGYEFYCLTNDRLVKNRSHGKQVGKTKVVLFEKELNNLHIWIGDTLIKTQPEENLKGIIKNYYKALRYRKMTQAARYIKSKYLKIYCNSFEYHFIVPIACGWLSFKGTLRNIARNIYRKIKVK